MAHGQVEATGRAYGSSAEILGVPFGLLGSADTGEIGAVEPGSFDELAAGASINLPPIAEVVASESRTAGSAAGIDSFVSSATGEVTASILPGAGGSPAVLDLVGGAAQATLSCEGFSLVSGVDALRLAGESLLDLDFAPNTSILAAGSGLDLITFNRQRVELDAASGVASIQVEALAVDLLLGLDVLTLSLAGASARLENLPPDCPVFQGPNFGESTKTATFVLDGGSETRVDPGDRIRFAIHVRNRGAEAADAAVVLDRMPTNASLVEGTLTLDGILVARNVTACPAERPFSGCPGETEVDTPRECLEVEVGTIAAGADRVVEFEVVATNAETMCNTAFVGGQEVTAIVLGAGAPTPDRLRTTGGGGCAISTDRREPGGDLGSVVLLGVVFFLSRRIRRAQRTFGTTNPIIGNWAIKEESDMKSKFRGWIGNLPYLAVAGGLLIAVTFAGCDDDDDGDGNGNSSEAEAVTSALQPLTEPVADLPVVGELVGTCTGEVLQIVDSVVAGIPASEGLEAIPVLGDLTQGLEGIPVLGGILAGEGGLSSLPIETATGLLSVPLSALEGLPVLGTLPLSCENLPIIGGESLSSIFGIVPIFDLAGEPIGIVLGIVQGLPLVGEIPGTAELIEVILSPLLDLGELAGTGFTDFGVLEPILSLLEGLPILSDLLAALPLPV